MQEQRVFDQKLWINAQTFSGDQRDNPRMTMYGDVQRLIQHLNRQEVEDLLGPPDTSYSTMISYYLGKLYSSENGRLFIDFDSQSMVTTSRVELK
jgi:hypothetical protein